MDSSESSYLKDSISESQALKTGHFLRILGIPISFAIAIPVVVFWNLELSFFSLLDGAVSGEVFTLSGSPHCSMTSGHLKLSRRGGISLKQRSLFVEEIAYNSLEKVNDSYREAPDSEEQTVWNRKIKGGEPPGDWSTIYLNVDLA